MLGLAANLAREAALQVRQTVSVPSGLLDLTIVNIDREDHYAIDHYAIAKITMQ